MSQQFRHQLLIILATATVFFTNLGATGLWDKDETLYSSCAREMYEAGNWIVPTFNGEVFPDKPPLMYWLMMSGYMMFGVGELAVRFWSAVLGIGTALATYHLGRLLFRERVGLWAGLIVGSSVIFTVSARAATVDSALTFATMLAMLAFVIGAVRANPNGKARNGKARNGKARTVEGTVADKAPLGEFHPNRWTAWALMYAAIGLAVLAKGPIGVVLPVGTIGLFLMLTTGKACVTRHEATSGRDIVTRGIVTRGIVTRGIVTRGLQSVVWFIGLLAPRNVFRLVWQMRPVTAVIVVGLITVPWFVAVGIRTDGVWLERFFGQQNLGRAMNSMQGHGGPIFYYFIAILIGFFPWSTFLGPSLVEMVQRIRKRHQWRTPYILIACWLTVYVLFWSLVSTKLPHYVLPAYPALALLTAAFVEGWIADPARVRPCWGRIAATILVVVGVGMLVALPIITSIYLPGEWPIALVGLVLIVGGGICLYWLRQESPSRAMQAFAVTSVVFLTSVFGFSLLRVARYQNAPILLTQINNVCPGTPDLAAYVFFKESYVFYAGGGIPRYTDSQSLRQFLDSSEYPFVITSDEHAATIDQAITGQLYEFARRPRLLHSGEVVVLARRADRHALRMGGNSESNDFR